MPDALVNLFQRDSHWVLDGDPYILDRAANAIPAATRSRGGKLRVPMTDEAAVELLWFNERFRFNCNDRIGSDLRKASGRFKMATLQANMARAGKPIKSVDVKFRVGKKARDYQIEDCHIFRTKKRVLFAHQLGVGKTISAATSIASPEHLPALIVPPATLTYHWKEQLEDFLANVDVHIVASMKNYKTDCICKCSSCGEVLESIQELTCPHCLCQEFEWKQPDVWICPYSKIDAWKWTLGGVGLKSMVLDEAQFLRTGKSKRYKAVHELSNKVEGVVALSGTPIHNYGGEIYNVMDALSPGVFGTRGNFNANYCEFDPSKAAQKLREPEVLHNYLVRNNLMVRRTRKDVGREIPPSQRIIQEVDFNMETFQREARNSDAKRLAKSLLNLTNKQSDRFHEESMAFDAIMRQATGIAKAESAASFTEMLLESGEPVILFGYSRPVYEIWMHMLKPYKPAFWTGSETPALKQKSRKDFMDGETSLFICSLASSTGIDGLQHRCNVGVFGELDWSPAVIDQSEGRYARDGQKNPTMTYILMSDYGTDPPMSDALGVKAGQIKGLLGDKSKSSVLSPEVGKRNIRALAQRFLEVL